LLKVKPGSKKLAKEFSVLAKKMTLQQELFGFVKLNFGLTRHVITKAA
jgi:hypothetical protein